MLYFTYTFNQRAEKIDSKADKEYVDMKNAAQDQKIQHNREILELSLGNTNEDVVEIKEDIKYIKEILDKDRKQ
jgi:hypothetical protein